MRDSMQSPQQVLSPGEGVKGYLDHRPWVYPFLSSVELGCILLELICGDD